jgi:DNA-binding CsgD family transcriptional regulator
VPIQSVILFLAAILASALLLGFSFALRSRHNARYLDLYFYFIVAVVSYGFVNWIGPSIVAYFTELGADKSTDAILVFAAFAVPLSLVKLYLFVVLLLGLLERRLSRLLAQMFYVIALLSTALAGFLLSRDFGSAGLGNSRSFLILFGVLVVALSYLAIVHFLSRIDSLKSEPLEKHARRFGWSYLVGYFVYTSPYYLAYFVVFPWYQTISPYVYYAMHLVPLIFLRQFVLQQQRESSASAIGPADLDSVTSKYGISNRERTILALVLEGKSNNEIADQLFISHNTVRNHIFNIYGKLQVKNRIQLKRLCDGQVPGP